MSQLSSSYIGSELEVDGVKYCEEKELEITINEEGNKEITLTHRRIIGDQKYTVIRFLESREEHCETQMPPEEIEDFKNKWDEKWQPSIVEQSTDIMSWMMRNLTTF